MIDDLIPLSEVCEKYWGLSLRIAMRRAAMGTLPVPAFRLNNMRKGPVFVHREELEKWAEKQRAAATTLHRHMTKATA